MGLVEHGHLSGHDPHSCKLAPLQIVCVWVERGSAGRKKQEGSWPLSRLLPQTLQDSPVPGFLLAVMAALLCSVERLRDRLGLRWKGRGRP